MAPPHSARRWFLVAYKRARRTRTLRSVSARSDSVGGGPLEECEQARKLRVRLRMLVTTVVKSWFPCQKRS
jgi:hypothetical protein